jgi:hypothetical protein
MLIGHIGDPLGGPKVEEAPHAQHRYRMRSGAPRSMKVGTTVSPWRYDAAARHALPSASPRRLATVRYASRSLSFLCRAYPSMPSVPINPEIDVMCQKADIRRPDLIAQWIKRRSAENARSTSRVALPGSDDRTEGPAPPGPPAFSAARYPAHSKAFPRFPWRPRARAEVL